MIYAQATHRLEISRKMSYELINELQYFQTDTKHFTKYVRFYANPSDSFNPFACHQNGICFWSANLICNFATKSTQQAIFGRIEMIRWKYVKMFSNKKVPKVQEAEEKSNMKQTIGTKKKGELISDFLVQMDKKPIAWTMDSQS